MPETIYRIDDGFTSETTTDAERAEHYSRQGCKVTAVTQGYL
jgi:hypothetical protein